MGVLPRGFFAKRGRCICGLKELLLSVNSIQDTVQALATQNIMNTNVHVEKEQNEPKAVQITGNAVVAFSTEISM